jgi:hypothetical protein
MPFPAGGNTKIIGHFLEKSLTKTLNRIYETQYTKLWGTDPALNFHQAIGDLPLTLDYIEAYSKSDGGQMAALYDGTGDDVPVVELAIGSRKYPAAMFIQGAHWNLLHVEKQRMAESLGQSVPTLNIITAKQDLVAEYFNRREHYTVLYGYPKVGIRGIFSQLGIATIDGTFQPYKKAAGAYTLTTALLYEDIIDILYAFMARAKLTSLAQIEIKIAPRLGRRMVEIYKTSAGESVGLTLMQMLQSTELGLGVTSVDVHNELAGDNLNKYVWNDSGTGMYPVTSDRMVLKAATYDPERHFYARRPFAPYQRSTLEYEQITVGATTGVINLVDESMMYYDYSNTQV